MTPIERLRAAGAAPKRRPAPIRVPLAPEAFADTYTMRPHEPVRVGLRLPSEKTVEAAVLLASKDVTASFAEALSSGRYELVSDAMIEMYNSQVMVNVLAHALCDPDDVTRPYFESAPNDMVQIALRPETIAMLWSELGTLRSSLNPTLRLATDEEVLAVGVEPARAGTKFRRLLALLHEEIENLPT